METRELRPNSPGYVSTESLLLFPILAPLPVPCCLHLDTLGMGLWIPPMCHSNATVANHVPLVVRYVPCFGATLFYTSKQTMVSVSFSRKQINSEESRQSPKNVTTDRANMALLRPSHAHDPKPRWMSQTSTPQVEDGGATITFPRLPITTCIPCPHLMIATETFRIHFLFGRLLLGTTSLPLNCIRRRRNKSEHVCHLLAVHF